MKDDLNGLIRLWQPTVPEPSAFKREVWSRIERRGIAERWLELFAIATNLARQHLRWKLRHPTVSIDLPAGRTPHAIAEILPSSEPDPRTRLEEDERTEAVWGAIAELPADLREALILFEYEEISYDQTQKFRDVRPRRSRPGFIGPGPILRKRLERWLRAV